MAPSIWYAAVAAPQVNPAGKASGPSGDVTLVIVPPWTGNYIPDLKQDFVSKDPAHHHYREAAGSSNALWPNLNEWPTGQLAVRQAIDVAINRTILGTEGESGLEAALTNASGITLPAYAQSAALIAQELKAAGIPPCVIPNESALPSGALAVPFPAEGLAGVNEAAYRG